MQRISFDLLKSAWRCAVTLAVGLAAVSAVTAQIPDEFTNLKVLPADISKPELISKMKEMATSLGVRCQFCHMGDPEKGLASFDFASDRKEHKQTARIMLRMTDAVNADYLSALGDEQSGAPKVSCYTCHHGYREPKSLKEELAAVLDSHGIDSTVAHYRKLRAEFYGRAVYDFGETVLVELATQLALAGKGTDAVALLRLNHEQFPESVGTYQALAMAQMTMGQAADAISSLEKALAIDPDNAEVKAFLQRLRGDGER
jgi:tetratricopeptide (TPR) repeat protein